jgi:hypothetical protein
MKKVRAPGMAFFLVALPMALYAGFGVDRLLRREVSLRALAVPLGILSGLALLGAIGVLQAVASGLASEQQMEKVAANAGALQLGALRLLVFVGLGGAALWLLRGGRLAGWRAAAALGVITVADLWSIDRLFFQFQPPAAELYRDDAVTSRLRKEPKPFRVLDVGVYQGSYLMAHDIQSMLGYHGFEVRFYDELLGGKGEWRFAGSPNLHDLLAVRYILLPEAQTVPGFHQVVGPVATTPGRPAILLERDTVPRYVRVVAGAAKLPEAQLAPTVIDPRFPLNSVVLYSDTTSVTPEPLNGQVPPVPNVRATLAEWAPGRMRIRLDGAASRATYLLIGETWYPDWHAEVDGRPVPVLRADDALLSVVLPPGARQVALHFHSTQYDRGRLITLGAVLLTGVMFAWPRVVRWRRGDA